MVSTRFSDDNKKLIIEVDLSAPTPSSTGKTHLVASERVKTDLKIDGKPLTVALNAYIK